MGWAVGVTFDGGHAKTACVFGRDRRRRADDGNDRHALDRSSG
ncbi:MAG: hypothetical protein ACXVRU_13990 [Gaiellaceae bacterium]